MTENHDDLISRYIEGRLSEKELKELDALVVSDPGIRRRLLLSASLETELSGILIAEAAADRVPLEEPIEPATRISSTRERLLHAPKRSIGSRMIPLAVAAGVMACLICGIAIQSARRQPDRPEIVAVPPPTPETTEPTQPQKTPAPPVAEPVKQGLKVVSLKGKVRVSPAGSAKATTLSRGDMVPTDVILNTERKGAVTLQYTDASSLQFGADTRFKLADKPAARDVHILRGQLVADIKHQAREALRFSTPDATLKVVGTRFWVYVCPMSGSFLKVQEGEIELTRKMDKGTSIIGAGQSANVMRASFRSRSMELCPTPNGKWVPAIQPGGTARVSPKHRTTAQGPPPRLQPKTRRRTE